jgi:hypothetical protein
VSYANNGDALDVSWCCHGGYGEEEFRGEKDDRSLKREVDKKVKHLYM